MTQKAVIIGAGWLGGALANHLNGEGWQVNASSRENNSVSQFPNVIFNCEDASLTHSIRLEDAYWFFCIPAGRTEQAQHSYFQYLEQALLLAKKLNCKGFLLASSTAAYPTAEGEYDEASDFELTSSRQARMHRAEQLVLSHQGKVLRLAGLFGPKRAPGRFLAGKELPSNGGDVVNMVHQQDCINAVTTLFLKWSQANAIYNCVSPDHPTKQDFYGHATRLLKLQPPHFSGDKSCLRKINGDKLTELDFCYQHHNLIDAITHC